MAIVIDKIAGFDEKPYTLVTSSGGSSGNVQIQAALDGLTSGRTWQEKVIVKGDFTISNFINVPAYTHLEIQGRLKANGSSFVGSGIIKLGNSATRQTDITITGGVIDGDYANVTANYHSAIYSDFVENVLIDNVKMIDNRNHGVDFLFTSNFKVQNCICDNNGDDGITVHDNSYGGIIFNNTCSNGRSATGGSSGIEIEGTDGVSCTITSSGTLATASQTAHKYTTNDRITVSGANEAPYNGEFIVTVTNVNTFTYVMASDPVDTATGTIFSGAAPSSISVIGNTITTMPLSCISVVSDSGIISAPWGISITDNNIYNTDVSGINIQGDSSIVGRSISIIGNNIRDSGDGSSSVSGIKILRTDNVTVQGNVIDNMNGNGIRASECSAVNISGNTIQGATLYGMRLISDLRSGIISNNVIRNCGNYAIRAEGDLNATISNNIFEDDQSVATMPGIQLFSTPANILICDNRFVNVKTDGANRAIQLPGTVGAGIRIRNNESIGAVTWVTETTGSGSGKTSGATTAHGCRPANSSVDFQVVITATSGTVDFPITWASDNSNITPTFTGGGNIDFSFEAHFPEPA